MRSALVENQNIQKVMDDQNVLSLRVLHCFSALRNVKYLLSTGSFADDIQCLHGIRVLSFFLIVFVHTGLEIIRNPFYNKDAVIQVNIFYYLQLY